MKQRKWPVAAKYTGPELTVFAHSRGGTGRGGHYGYERGKGAAWSGRLGVTSMRTADALTFRAFLHSLRGRSGSFYFPAPIVDKPASRPSPKAAYSDGTLYSDGTRYDDIVTTSFSLSRRAGAEYSDGTAYADGTAYSDAVPVGSYMGLLAADAAAGSDTIQVDADLAASPLATPGSFLTIGDVADGGQMVRVVEAAGAFLVVRPHLRKAVMAGAYVNLGRCYGLFRLDQATPTVPLIVGRSTPVELRIAEVY